MIPLCLFLCAFVIEIEAVSPPAPCPPVICAMYCPFGFAKDSDGCNKCECAPPHPKPYCPLGMCYMYCEHGFKTDDNGCEMCSCRDKPCPGQCRKFCASGFVRDENGCMKCECRSEEDIVKPGQCPAQPEYGGPIGCPEIFHINDCRGDQDCSGERKCCKDVCRNKCMDPVS